MQFVLKLIKNIPRKTNIKLQTLNPKPVAINPTAMDASQGRSLMHSDLVLKLNESGTMFNKRVLCVKDDVLFYYQNIPSSFIPNRFDILKGTPKAGVALEDIIKMSGQTYHKVNCFTLEFPKDKIIKYKGAKPSIMKPGNSNMGLLSCTDLSGVSSIMERRSVGDSKPIRWVFSTKNSEDPEKGLTFWLEFLFKAKLAVAQKYLGSDHSINENFGENSAMIVNKVKLIFFEFWS